MGPTCKIRHVLPATVLTQWVAPPKMFCNCGIARILGILLMNSWDT